MVNASAQGIAIRIIRVSKIRIFTAESDSKEFRIFTMKSAFFEFKITTTKKKKKRPPSRQANVLAAVILRLPRHI